MQELRLGDQVVRYDRDATVTAYAILKCGDADRCGCVYCRNFAAQRTSAYPLEFLSLLDQLGIDVGKEGEVFDMAGPFDLTSRPVGGWFYFVGEFVEAGERLIQSGEFRYWFQPKFPRPPACFGERVVAVEFSTVIPWLLKESAG
jgi:hypothetical protein